MTKREKDNILKEIALMSDEELKKRTGDLLYDSLGTQCDDMYELGYDMRDIEERRKYEKFIGDKFGIYDMCCSERGIDIFELEQNDKEKNNE